MCLDGDICGDDDDGVSRSRVLVGEVDRTVRGR